MHSAKLLLLSCLALLAQTRAEVVLYVSPSGSNSASGRSAITKDGTNGPLATLSQALTKRAEITNDSVRIVMAAGRYELSRTLLIRPEHSGTAQKPFIIQASPGARVVVSGSPRLTNWKRSVANPSLWTTPIPPWAKANGYLRLLFVDGKRWQRARIPNSGYLNTAAKLGSKSPIELPFKPGDLKQSWVGSGAELTVLMKWTDLHLPLLMDLDEQRNIALFQGGPVYSWMDEPDARYWVENSEDALDQPGEWVINRKTGFISLLGTDKFDPNESIVSAPVMETVVRLSGDPKSNTKVRHVVLKGITFAEAGYDMLAKGRISPQAAIESRGTIVGEYADDCAIMDCRIENSGGYGVEIGRGCQRWKVVGNEMVELGAGGIRIGEASFRGVDETVLESATSTKGQTPDENRRIPSPAANHSHRITDNHLHALGRIFPPACGILVLQSGTNYIGYNEINDLYYTAISVGWTWGYTASPCRGNIIEFNHLHDIGQGLLSDMGGVYTLGPQPGTVVRNNVIHDVQSYRYGGWGLYTDEGSSGIIMENNVVYRCKDAGFHQHYGKENVIRNNLLVDNSNHSVMRTRHEGHISFWFTNNVIVGDAEKFLGANWAGGPTNYVINGNLWWDPAAGKSKAKYRFSNYNIDRWKALGHDRNSVLEDPLLKDIKHPEEGLKSKSPAYKMGFRAIDTKNVGPRPARRRD
jgi:parallel beta-helix repeat protein